MEPSTRDEGGAAGGASRNAVAPVLDLARLQLQIVAQTSRGSVEDTHINSGVTSYPTEPTMQGWGGAQAMGPTKPRRNLFAVLTLNYVN